MARKTDTTSDNARKRSKDPSEVVSYWLNEIGAARKREDDFRKEGSRIMDIYSGKKKKMTPFNILFSNTETMQPALYSALPRPVVQRRFKDEDPMGKQAAVAAQRILEFMLDTNVDGYETFDDGMNAATLDGLLPGRGVTIIKYDFEEGEIAPAKPPESMTENPAGADASTGAPDTEPTPYKKSELVCVDSRGWNRVFFGYAKKWSKVPWAAYEEHIDREEATRLFGKEKADAIVYTTGEETDNEEDRTNSNADDRNTGERKTALVYQIWDKAGGRKVRYISAQYPDGFLLVQDDPLELTGFFNCPRPLMFVDKTNDLVPVPLYCLYENQAKELNELTLRISRIARAIKARGIYDTELGEDIKKLFEADDNEMVAADKSSSLAAEKGLQNAIWFAPIGELITVLEKLMQARENCKQVIYEIMGIADILRGATKASETFGAQKLKSEWGSLRLKPKQKEVQRYARDLLRMMLEVAATKFSEETWAKMTGLPFLLEPKFNELTAVAQALQGQVQQEAMQMQAMAAQTGAQPQQPPPSPAQQQLQQVQQQLQTPKWSDILAMLRDDMQRAYRIDIETNSTVEPEAVEDQKNIAEVMTALGQYLNGITPLVTSGAMPFQAAQAMMLAIVRRFRFGPEIEDYIKTMQAPKPPDDGKDQKAAADKAASDKAMMQKDAQAAQDKVASAQAIAAKDAEVQRLKIENDALKKQREMDARELDLAKRELAIESKDQDIKHRLELQNANDRERDQALKTQEAKFSGAIDKKLSAAQKQAEAATRKAVDESPPKAPPEVKELLAMVQKVAERVEEMAEEAGAPTEYDRDDKGKVVAIRKGKRTSVVKRDGEGRMSAIG